MIRILLFIIIVMVSTGCGGLAVKEKIVENYYFVAGDDPAGTFLSYHESSDGNNYSGIIEATVFAVGYNNNFMIVKQHPRKFPNPPDKSITNYYILPLKEGMDWRSKNGLIGPLTKSEFIKKRKELGVPNNLTFTKILKDLQ
jgi:hypothetical protein